MIHKLISLPNGWLRALVMLVGAIFAFAGGYFQPEAFGVLLMVALVLGLNAPELRETFLYRDVGTVKIALVALAITFIAIPAMGGFYFGPVQVWPGMIFFFIGTAIPIFMTPQKLQIAAAKIEKIDHPEVPAGEKHLTNTERKRRNRLERRNRRRKH